MRRKLFALIITFVLCVITVNSVFANEDIINSETNYHLVIEDDAALLSESEVDSLVNDMMPLTEYGNIVFKSTNENSQSVKGYAHDCYYDKFGEASGSLLLIDMANREIYIHSDGENNKIITDGKSYSITDNVYKYASNNDYYSCASEAFNEMNTLLSGYKIMEPMRYISAVLISLTIGFLTCFILIMIKSRNGKPGKEEILKNCNISFETSKVVATKVGEHRTYSPQSSSSSSGFSSGGHSSGGGGHSSHSSHSSGGGGGHRF